MGSYPDWNLWQRGAVSDGASLQSLDSLPSQWVTQYIHLRNRYWLLLGTFGDQELFAGSLGVIVPRYFHLGLGDTQELTTELEKYNRLLIVDGAGIFKREGNLVLQFYFPNAERAQAHP